MAFPITASVSPSTAAPGRHNVSVVRIENSSTSSDDSPMINVPMGRCDDVQEGRPFQSCTPHVDGRELAFQPCPEPAIQKSWAAGVLKMGPEGRCTAVAHRRSEMGRSERSRKFRTPPDFSTRRGDVVYPHKRAANAVPRARVM
jgi:hypothetical protein